MNFKESLNHFINKPCTIFTVPINKNFKDEKEFMVYSLGTIESVDEKGIILKHLARNTKSYVFLDKIISINEEEVLDTSKEEEAKLIEKYKKINNDSPYVNPENLKNLAETFKKYGE
jgi:hypothetical protein